MSLSRAAVVLAVFLFILSPIISRAWGQGGKLTLMPEVSNSGNSQTMDLLQSFVNSNPLGIGGPEIAIVDGTAIEASSEDAGAFIDLGKSGNGTISTYIVRKGDTLSEIADMFGVSKNTIIWANDIKGGVLKEGQELVILPVSGVKHVVKSGDTMKSIAAKYKADLNDVLSYNGLTIDSKLKIGDVILVPDGEITASQSAGSLSTGNNTAVSAGYYMRPIIGGRKSQGIHGHNAVDLAAPYGTAIMAAADGKVILARVGGWNGGYGNYVIIAHANGTQTVYGHMNKVNVSVGDTVSRGQVIGSIGMTGNTSGPHVHFEIRGARNPF